MARQRDPYAFGMSGLAISFKDVISDELTHTQTHTQPRARGDKECLVYCSHHALFEQHNK